MRLSLSLLATLGAAGVAIACPGIDHEQGLKPRSQRGATQPSAGTSLIRPLTWGSVNVISTTDIHGWYQGHLKGSQPEPNFSGDWGDFASFVLHMRFEAKKRNVDLLIADSGDLHDGNGIVDGIPAGQVAGHVGDEFHNRVKYDVLAIGNHELYNYTIAKDVYDNFRPAQKGRYLASNVNITINNQSYPMGERYVKFTTDLGRKVTSMGVLFDFTGADKGLTVQKVADMVKEPWFAEALKERPDFFLLPGHMPVRKDKWPIVVNAIRAKHPSTPILILGGHTHIRDCAILDGNAVGLEAGRYLETIGWLAVNSTSFPPPRKGFKPPPSPSPAPGANLTFSRSYIDANRRNYAFHAGLTQNRFDTLTGRIISFDLQRTADSYNLGKNFGQAPQDYYLSRVPINNTNSLLNLLTYKVLPSIISTSNPERNGTASIVLVNSGSQRFDIYAGNFTRNDQFIVSPFLDAFLYIKDVELQYAEQIIGKLNKAGAYKRSEETLHEDADARYASGEVEHIFQAWRRKQFVASTEAHAAQKKDLEELDARADAQDTTLGYITKDDCPGLGDDTAHTAIPYAAQPDYVQSPPSGNSTALTPTTLIDVVFLDFIETSVISILNGLQTAKVYSTSDVQPYNKLTTQDLYPLYAQKSWQGA